MDPTSGKAVSLRTSNKPRSEPPITVDTYYEQYKTENIQSVFKDYYPSAESSQEEKDLLMLKRLEVSKAANRLEADKKSFTASNQLAAQEREKEGVRGCDWAYTRNQSLQNPGEKI